MPVAEKALPGTGISVATSSLNGANSVTPLKVRAAKIDDSQTSATDFSLPGFVRYPADEVLKYTDWLRFLDTALTSWEAADTTSYYDFLLTNMAYPTARNNIASSKDVVDNTSIAVIKSSLPAATLKTFADAVMGKWGIINSSIGDTTKEQAMRLWFNQEFTGATETSVKTNILNAKYPNVS